MFFWRILEPCLVFLSVLFVFTQIIFPAFMDRPLFPLFRKSNKELNKAIEESKELNVLQDVKEVKQTVSKKKKQLEKESKENGNKLHG
jgi:hypothetical protein